jgi:cytochrome c oxidase cbb3-type subunit IV
MYKFVLQGIENIEIWPIIGLILFLSVFTVGVIYAVTADKKYVDHMQNLPLEDEDKENINKS